MKLRGGRGRRASLDLALAASSPSLPAFLISATTEPCAEAAALSAAPAAAFLAASFAALAAALAAASLAAIAATSTSARRAATALRALHMRTSACIARVITAAAAGPYILQLGTIATKHCSAAQPQAGQQPGQLSLQPRFHLLLGSSCSSFLL